MRGRRAGSLREGMTDFMMEEDDDGEEGEEGSMGEGDEEEEEPAVEEEPAERPNAADPRSSHTYMLPSLFLDRPATVWIDYPKFMGMERLEGSETIFELEDKRLKPLTFKSARNINCIANCFKRVWCAYECYIALKQLDLKCAPPPATSPGPTCTRAVV